MDLEGHALLIPPEGDMGISWFLGQDPLGHQLGLVLCGRRKPAGIPGSLTRLPCLSFTDGSPDALQNPCYIGTHGCDTNAACRPGPGVQFTCECSIGFRGDGRICSGTTIPSDLWGLGKRPGGGVRSLQTRGLGEEREGRGEHQGVCQAPHLGFVWSSCRTETLSPLNNSPFPCPPVPTFHEYDSLHTS